MTADAFPLGHAPHLMVQTAPDGTETVVGRFVRHDDAVRGCAFLAKLGSENRFDAVTETPVLPGLEGRV